MNNASTLLSGFKDRIARAKKNPNILRGEIRRLVAKRNKVKKSYKKSERTVAHSLTKEWQAKDC